MQRAGLETGETDNLLQISMRIKTYLANSVLLRHVPAEHRATNGNCQFTIVVRSASHRKVAEMLGPGCSLHCLRSFYGIHVDEARRHIAKKDETIYYQPGHTANGYIQDWFEYHG